MTSSRGAVYLSMEKLNKVTRLEVIDAAGRRYVNWEAAGLEFSFQDDERTLKIFAPNVGAAINNDLNQEKQMSESVRFGGFI